MKSAIVKGSKIKADEMKTMEGNEAARGAFVKGLFIAEEMNASIMEVTLPKGYSVPMHKHDHHSLGYTLKGRAKKIIEGGGEFLVEPGDVYYHPPGEVHTTRALEDYVEVEVKSPPATPWKREKLQKEQPGQN